MLEIRRASTADAARWDSYVEKHTQALLGHQFAWYEIIAAFFNITPHYWLAEQNGQVVGIAPFFLRSHIGLGKRLTSMPYFDNGGILADSLAVQSALWDAVSAWALDNRVDSLELRNRHVFIPGFPVRGGRATSMITLEKDEESAWNKLRSSARNRVRKAEKAGLTVAHGFEHFDGFWRAYAENMRLLGAPVLPRDWFLTLAKSPELAHLITVLHEGAVVSGMVLLCFKDGAENGWTASTYAARSLYCNDLLYWEAIRWLVSQGKTWLDLGRSQAGSGHERFKEKFGAEIIPLQYQEMRRTRSGWQSSTSEPLALYRAFMAVWTRLPLPLATRLGPYFSRQIY